MVVSGMKEYESALLGKDEVPGYKMLCPSKRADSASATQAVAYEDIHSGQKNGSHWTVEITSQPSLWDFWQKRKI